MTAAKLCTLAQSDETAPAVFSGSNSARMRLLARSAPADGSMCVHFQHFTSENTGFQVLNLGRNATAHPSEKSVNIDYGWSYARHWNRCAVGQAVGVPAKGRTHVANPCTPWP